MTDEELKRRERSEEDKKNTLRRLWKKVKALLDECEPPLANQLKTYRVALKEKLNVLGFNERRAHRRWNQGTGNFRESIHQMMVEIDEILNAVELEKVGNTDKSIHLLF